MFAVIARHKARAAIVLALVAVGLILGVRFFRGTEVEVAIVRPQVLVQSVVATGRIMSPARIDIGSVITGRVTAVKVREGDQVTPGQVLLELERAELEAAAAQARAAEDSAKARVANVAELGLVTAAEALAQAEATLRWNDAELRRNRELRDGGFIGPAKLEESERAQRVARSQVDAARTQMRAQGRGGVQAREALARLAEARAARELAEAKLEQTTLRASVAGTILTRTAEPGDIAQPAKVLLTLAAAGETRITAQVNEKNLPYLQVGAKATAAADAFPETRFAAEVYYIAPGMDAQRGTVETRLRVAAPPLFLRADMTLSVEILGARKEDALVVPTGALSNGNGGPALLVVEDGKAASRAVKLGLRGDGNVEVQSGIRAGEMVLLSPVAPGTRVRAKQAPARAASP